VLRPGTSATVVNTIPFNDIRSAHTVFRASITWDVSSVSRSEAGENQGIDITIGAQAERGGAHANVEQLQLIRRRTEATTITFTL
jgi:hypothetical protein